MQNPVIQLGFLTLAIYLMAGPACPQNYNLPWCGISDETGNLNCAYNDEQQCLTTLSGIGGRCVPNPSPPTPALAPTEPFSNIDPGPPPGFASPPGLDGSTQDPGPPPGLDGSPARQTVVIPNNLFTAAGFVVKYATTPGKRAILRSLPPDRIVTRTKDGKLYYVYADAALCNCAYVGTPQAYAAYQNGGINPNSDGGSQQLTTMQTIDGDVEAPDVMNSILDPQF